METFQVDIRLYTVMALGSNRLIHSEIDTMYKEDEVNYYKAYKESNYFNCPMFTMFTTAKEERIKKVAGIVQYDYHSNSDDHILCLIKKGYKLAWNYVKDRNDVDINDFTIAWVRRQGGIDNVSEIDMFNQSIIAMYLCIKLKKKYFIELTYQEALNRFFRESQLNCYLDNLRFNQEIIKQHREEIDALYKRFLIPKKNGQLLDSILDNINVAEIKNMSQAPLSQKAYDYFVLRDLSYKQGISRYIGALSGWLKVLGINEMDLTANITLDIKDLDKIFLEYLLARTENAIPENNTELFVVAIILMQALAKEYNKLKEDYVTDLKDNFYYNFNKLQDSVKKEKSELTQQKLQFVTVKDKLESENINLKNALKSSKKEILRLQFALKEQDNDRKELLALREYVFSLQTSSLQNEEVSEDGLQEILQFLQSKKCVVIGGNQNWIKKMKAVLPSSFVFVDAESRNKDFHFLDNLDGVFINTDHNSHSIYDKVMERMRKNETPLFYITNTTNIKDGLVIIYKNLKL